MFYAAILRLFLGDSKFNLLSGRASNPLESNRNVVPASKPSTFGLGFLAEYGLMVYSTKTLLPSSKSSIVKGGSGIYVVNIDIAAVPNLVVRIF